MNSQLETILSSIPNTKEVTRDKKKRSLLIIDDNRDVIDALTMILKEDYSLLVCQSYEDIQNNVKVPFPVALLDIKIAYKNGIEIFPLLKEIYPNIKIIFHSAYAGDNEQALLTESLAHSGYLTKGEYDIQKLIHTLERVYT